MATKKEKLEALENLKRTIKPGTRLILSISHVSRSGMFRVVRAMIDTPTGFIHPNWMIAKSTGYRAIRDYHDGIGVGGCGFDATLDVGLSVGHALGFAVWQSRDLGYGHGYKRPAYTKAVHHMNGWVERVPARKGQPGAEPTIYLDRI